MSEPRPALLDCFDPPGSDVRGTFALICGFSAERDVIDAVIERFACLSETGRRHQGRLVGAVFLDGAHPRLSDIGGIYQAFLRPPASRATKWHRMHAKVALLGFGPATRGATTKLRLIVGTGNWTTLTLRTSIDLFWFVDVDLETTTRDDDAAADVAEAARFFGDLVAMYAMPEDVRSRVDALIEVATSTTAARRRAPRFIHTLPTQRTAHQRAVEVFAERSIGAQVVHRFQGFHRGDLLAVGSCFFEAADGRGSEPVVLSHLHRALTEAHVLRQVDCQRWLACEPATAGAVALWANATRPLGWDLVRPKHPDGVSTFCFHAKYVGAFRTDGASLIRRGRLYLGSGNLSRRGFLWAPTTPDRSVPEGNVEAGVVLDVDEMPTSDLCTALGIDGKRHLDPKDLEVVVGEDDNDSPPEVPVPPLIAFRVDAQRPMRLLLCWIDDQAWHRACDVVLPDGRVVAVAPGQEAIEVPSPVSELEVCIAEHRWWIPVFLGDGEFVRPPPVPREFDDVLSRLLAFPVIDETADDDAADPDAGVASDAPDLDRGAQAAADRAYALHRLTTLVEHIAQRNQVLSAGSLPDWIDWLARALLDELPVATRAAFADAAPYALAPLSGEAGFAPPSADASWVALVERVLTNWQQAVKPAPGAAVRGL